MTQNEEGMREWLGEALRGQRPATTAREMNLTTRPQRRKLGLWLPTAAAAAILALLVSSLTIPMVAWALAQTPLLGGTYARFLEGTGLDVAYQAGLVKELNRVVVHEGLEVVIVAAYRDANQTVVVHQISSGDSQLLEHIWEDSSDLMPRFVFPRGWSGSSTMQYIAEENVIYGISHIDPGSWGIFGEKLTMQIPSLDLTLTFPVQSVAANLSSRVLVKTTAEFHGITLRVDDVVFSPSSTRVNYTILSSGGQRVEQILNSMSWTLETESGARLTSMSAGLTNSRDGHVNFMPTDSSTVQILYWDGDSDIIIARVQR